MIRPDPKGHPTILGCWKYKIWVHDVFVLIAFTHKWIYNGCSSMSTRDVFFYSTYQRIDNTTLIPSFLTVINSAEHSIGHHTFRRIFRRISSVHIGWFHWFCELSDTFVRWRVVEILLRNLQGVHDHGVRLGSVCNSFGNDSILVVLPCHHWSPIPTKGNTAPHWNVRWIIGTSTPTTRWIRCCSK